MTKEILKILFPKTKNIDEVISIIDKYRASFKVDTPLRLAMFLSQVREEVGEDFKVVRENLNYNEASVLKTFKNITIEEAEKYARDEDTPVTNQVAIANIVYASKLGNGNKDSNSNGKLDEDDDGWKYRGAGCLQITGKYNFQEVQKRCLKILGREVSPDTLEGFIIFGMALWYYKDLYLKADTGNIDKVTEIINKYTDSYEKRKAHYNKIKHLV